MVFLAFYNMNLCAKAVYGLWLRRYMLVFKFIFVLFTSILCSMHCYGTNNLTIVQMLNQQAMGRAKDTEEKQAIKDDTVNQAENAALSKSIVGDLEQRSSNINNEITNNNPVLKNDESLDIQNIPAHTYAKKEHLGNKIKWSVNKNDSLHSTLYLWSKNAEWNLVWHSDYDYKLFSSATFNGDYHTAVTDLFKSLGELTPPLYVRFYPENKTLVIDGKPDN